MEGVGTDKICIYGKSQLLGTEHAVMPDRIETGTFILAAAITRSCISLSPVSTGWLSSLIDKLSGAGCKITHKNDTLEVYNIQLDQSVSFSPSHTPHAGRYTVKSD